MSDHSPLVQVISRLKLSEPEKAALLRRIAARDPKPAAREQRRSPRHAVRGVMFAQLTTHELRERRVWHQAILNDLSDHGIGLFHHGYIHFDTPVSVLLKSEDGELFDVPGEVRRCALIAGMVHEVGVEFLQPIDAAGFLNIETNELDAKRQMYHQGELFGDVA